MISDTAGLILAGGLATRMQQGESPPVDKGLLPLQGRPLVAHVASHLTASVSKLYISANRNLDTYAGYGSVVVDEPSLGLHAGPLAGVATALARVQQPWLLVWPVDVPVVPPDLLRQLAAAVHAAGSRLAYVNTDDGPQPLCMLVHRELAASLRDYLLGGGRKVQYWQEANAACGVPFHAQGMQFFNVNTPQDLQTMAKRLP